MHRMNQRTTPASSDSTFHSILRSAVGRLRHKVRPVVGWWVLALTVLWPLSAAAQPPDARQMTLLRNNCAQCHINPATGAPQLGQAGDWQEALARGEDALLRSVVEGRGGMPPLGYCSACSQADFRVLIRVLTQQPSAPEGET